MICPGEREHEIKPSSGLLSFTMIISAKPRADFAVDGRALAAGTIVTLRTRTAAVFTTEADVQPVASRNKQSSPRSRYNVEGRGSFQRSILGSRFAIKVRKLVLVEWGPVRLAPRCLNLNPL